MPVAERVVSRTRETAGLWGGVLIAVLLFLSSVLSTAQDRDRPQVLVRPAPRFPKNSITISGGWTVPLSHAPIREFWKPGASAALAMYVNVNRLVALGIGAEAAYFVFDKPAFDSRYPGDAQHPLDVGNLHLFLAWKYTGRLGTVISPTIGATVGVSKMTKAVYRVRTGAGVRKTYYEIPGMARATLGGTAGVEIAMNRGVSLAVEGRVQYVHNDPQTGILAGGRLGLRFNLY
jgi:hypothetical protein